MINFFEIMLLLILVSLILYLFWDLVVPLILKAIPHLTPKKKPVSSSSRPTPNPRLYGIAASERADYDYSRPSPPKPYRCKTDSEYEGRMNAGFMTSMMVLPPEHKHPYQGISPEGEITNAQEKSGTDGNR